MSLPLRPASTHAPLAHSCRHGLPPPLPLQALAAPGRRLALSAAEDVPYAPVRWAPTLLGWPAAALECLTELDLHQVEPPSHRVTQLDRSRVIPEDQVGRASDSPGDAYQRPKDRDRRPH